MPSESVEVLFNYQYDTSEGRHITINKGDVFTLLAKSTAEWWKVRRGDREKFYVPANYVRVVGETNKLKTRQVETKTDKSGASDSISINTDIPDEIMTLNGHHRNDSNTSNNYDSTDSQSRSDSFGSQGEGYSHNSMDKNVTLPRPNITPAAPQTNGVHYMNSSLLNLDLKPSITITSDVSPSPDSQPVDYANMEIIQEIIAQRKENEHLQSSDNSDQETWEMHTDDDTGKAYYFNSVTKETTWDSPVIRRRTNRAAKDVIKSKASPATTKRLSRITSFRKGWTETIAADGAQVYVHNATGDKWHMAVDASGKEYYYKENSQESLWELPEMSDEWPAPPPTLTNIESAVQRASTAATIVAPPPSSTLSDRNSGVTQEEPALRFAPPVPLPRRSSVDVFGVTNQSSQPMKYSTLPANQRLSSAATDPQFILSAGGLTPRNAAQTATAFDTSKKGYLHRAKITEGKKKVKKTWSLAYVVAYDNNLLIYKDEKAANNTPEAEFGKPEAIIDLKHATVDWSTKDKSNRKNVLEVTSASGTCYLFQHDDNILIHQWHTIILGKVKRFNSAAAVEKETAHPPPESLLTIPETEGNNNNEVKTRDNSKRKHSRRFSKSNAAAQKKSANNGGGKSVYTLHEENAEFQAPASLGPAGEVAKVSIRDKLRKFLTRRPTPEALEKQGILQTEAVFGSRLQFICDRESTTVPKFVVRCIKTIERKGLDFDGLYRISGNQAQIQKLRYLVDSTEDYNLADYDINVLTGALKLFFRELKEPLIPFKLYNILSETIRDKDQPRRLRTMKLQLATMPTVNKDTLKFLFAHLVRVHEHVSENRMRSQNIAIVFGPTLMWPEKESSAIAVNMMCQNSIVEYILSGFDKLF